MRTAIIHAVGVVFFERRETSNIIHAGGVRAALPSSAPKARMVRLITMARQKLPYRGDACEPVAQILEVARTDLQVEHLLDHWQEVS